MLGGEVVRLARECLEAELNHRETTGFAALVELLDEAISTGQDLSDAFKEPELDDPLLKQYVGRILRRVAAEEQVPAASEKLRLVLFGQVLLIPPWFRISGSKAWPAAFDRLTRCLEALWAEEVESVKLAPALGDVDSLWQLSPQDIRAAVLELFGDERSLLLEQGLPQGDWNEGWVPVIIPGVAAVKPSAAQAFVAERLAPAGPTRELAAIKHRFESLFETEDEPAAPTPRWFPPTDWANLFSVARGLHFRTQLQYLVQAHPGERKHWMINVALPYVRVTNFRARVSQEFWFPEETEGDIDRLIRPLMMKLGLHFPGTLH